MNDLITPTHRPDFASVQLAADLQKLEEDWLRLEHRMQRPHALTGMNDLARTHMTVVYRFECAAVRRHLIDGQVSFDAAKTVRDVLEAAFHVVRRAVNGLPPLDHFVPVMQLADKPIQVWPADDDWPAEEL